MLGLLLLLILVGGLVGDRANLASFQASLGCGSSRTAKKGLLMPQLGAILLMLILLLRGYSLLQGTAIFSRHQLLLLLVGVVGGELLLLRWLMLMRLLVPTDTRCLEVV